MPRLEAITIHSRRPAVLAAFSSAALGLPIDPHDALAIESGTLGESESVLLGRRDGEHVWIAAARELAPAPGRVHLDVRLDDHADLNRLISLGGVPQWQDPNGRWQVLADPDGNLFCALAARAPKPSLEHRCT